MPTKSPLPEKMQEATLPWRRGSPRPL